MEDKKQELEKCEDCFFGFMHKGKMIGTFCLDKQLDLDEIWNKIGEQCPGWRPNETN